MLHRPTLPPSLRLFGSTSLLLVAFIAGLSVSPTTASTPRSHVEVRPPADTSSSSCEAEALAYATAYASYEVAVNTLNDAYDALYACEYGGGQYVPSAKRQAKLASLRSIVEDR